MSEHIRVVREGAVGVLTIDRPHRFGSLDVETARDLRRAGLQLARDEAVRAVVLRGSHGVFCSGADLKYIREGGDQEDLGYLSPGAREVPGGHGAVFKQILEYLHATISEIRRSPKPWIAAVDGAAAAGGLGLAIACDLVVASARSTFEYAYFKTALPGAESSTWFLPKMLGLRRALDLALLNPRLSAEQARELGLVSRVVSEAEFEREVGDLARRLSVGPTAAYAEAKRLMNEATGGELMDRHLDRELEALVRLADGPDVREGIEAFFEKRPATFEGR
ncbi:MAG: enoyl-CoA hydratase/isomerase family protein [Deltaproteobacteria bacterium]|nr:enoyl-CoA hydratase/isomerase family protein [Deltaproteobacteria bacterium]